MIKELFTIPEKLTARQIFWLKICGEMPNIKTAMNDTVTPEDVEMSKEANEIIKEKE